ncbi:MAG: CRISPR system precrRNA processing endoribonuclease RAMP protein Cas6 [Anaerolineae bacterium]|nr:CRISPR system precrRNA processing endoribonuclease RAMP protein Cas6 [Anaerolineae bacterium]
MNEQHPFTVHHLRFEVQALTPLVLPAHAGPSIRGALFAALQRHFCPIPATERPGAEHKAICPVCWLMATEKPDARTGQSVPRPYTVEPPLSEGKEPDGQGWHLDEGDRFSFGVTLFAQALNLFPYLVVAMPIMGQAGMGAQLRELGNRRGQFALRRIDAINPLRGQVATILGEGQTQVQMPDVPVTARDVATAADYVLNECGKDGRVEIRYWTPTRIIEAGRLVHRPWPGPVVRRLLERLDALRGEYAGEPPVEEREKVQALADGVRLVHDATRWIDLSSGSRRLGRSTPIGGFVGRAQYEATAEAWKALLPYLIWGQEVHVGKNATKGDGWIEITAASQL